MIIGKTVLIIVSYKSLDITDCCYVCKFWDSTHYDPDLSITNFGDCRKHAPGKDGCFAQVQPYELCGDFVDKEIVR